MSYILEALEKSDQERKQRAVPDLQTKHTLYPGMTRARVRRKPLLYRHLWPAVLFAGILVVAGWLYRDYLPVALEIKITRQSEMPASPVQERTAIASEQEIRNHPAQLISRDGAGQIVEHNPAPSDTTAGRTGTEQLATVPTAEPESPDERIAQDSPTAGDRQETALVNHPDVRLQPAPIILPDSSDSKAVSTVPPLPFLEELPASVRKELPELKFAGHTYSAASKNRMIIINSGIKREGDIVEPGLQLEEITWEGVILNFRGTRFQVITTSS